MVKKKVVEEVVPEIKVPDPAPKLEHLKQLLKNTEQKNEFQFASVSFPHNNLYLPTYLGY